MTTVLLYPFFEVSATGRAVTAVFGILVLGAALLAVRATPMLTWVAASIAVPSVVLLTVQVSIDELFAIGAVFTLIAWAFAHTYAVVQALVPGSSTAYVHPEDPRTWSGLSDVMPIKPHARSVVMFEQVAGVFYLAMVVTRLIGLSAMRKRQ